MSNPTDFDRYDTGILSLADLFRRDRLPCRAEPKRWTAASRDSSTARNAPACEARANSGQPSNS